MIIDLNGPWHGRIVGSLCSALLDAGGHNHPQAFVKRAAECRSVLYQATWARPETPGRSTDFERLPSDRAAELWWLMMHIDDPAPGLRAASPNALETCQVEPKINPTSTLDLITLFSVDVHRLSYVAARLLARGSS